MKLRSFLRFAALVVILAAAFLLWRSHSLLQDKKEDETLNSNVHPLLRRPGSSSQFFATRVSASGQHSLAVCGADSLHCSKLAEASKLQPASLTPDMSTPLRRAGLQSILDNRQKLHRHFSQDHWSAFVHQRRQEVDATIFEERRFLFPVRGKQQKKINVTSFAAVAAFSFIATQLDVPSQCIPSSPDEFGGVIVVTKNRVDGALRLLVDRDDTALSQQERKHDAPPLLPPLHPVRLSADQSMASCILKVIAPALLARSSLFSSGSRVPASVAALCPFFTGVAERSDLVMRRLSRSAAIKKHSAARVFWVASHGTLDAADVLLSSSAEKTRSRSPLWNLFSNAAETASPTAICSAAIPTVSHRHHDEGERPPVRLVLPTFLSRHTLSIWARIFQRRTPLPPSSSSPSSSSAPLRIFWALPPKFFTSSRPHKPKMNNNKSSSTRPLSPSFYTLLLESTLVDLLPPHTAVEFVDPSSSIDLARDLLHAIETNSHVSTRVDDVAAWREHFETVEADVLVTVASDITTSMLCGFFASKRERDDRGAFLFPPVGTSAADAFRVEDVKDACCLLSRHRSSRIGSSSSFLLWHRSALETDAGAAVVTRPSTSTPYLLDEREAQESWIELAGALRSWERFSGAGAERSSPPEPETLSCGGVEVRRFHRRSVVDPDYFSLRRRASSADSLLLGLNASSRSLSILTSGQSADSSCFFDSTTVKQQIDSSSPSFSHLGKRERKLLKLGNMSQVRVAFYSESGGLTDWSVRVGSSNEASPPSCCIRSTTVFVHQPWVLDNVYHTHNDNVIPLLLEMVDHGLLSAHASSSTTLVVLPSPRKNAPLPVFDFLASHIFNRVIDLRKNHSTAAFSSHCQVDGTHFPVCFSGDTTLVWGRPPRPFSANATDVARYFNSGAIVELRKVLKQIITADRSRIGAKSLAASVAWPKSATSAGAIRVVLLERRSKRVMLNDAAFAAILAQKAFEFQQQSSSNSNDNVSFVFKTCCEGDGMSSFAAQVALVATADILIGVHGAGGLHALYLGMIQRSNLPAPLVVHLASRRLNYHEQTVIERLAQFAAHAAVVEGGSPPRFMTTRSLTGAKDSAQHWSDDFELDDLGGIADRILSAFFG